MTQVFSSSADADTQPGGGETVAQRQPRRRSTSRPIRWSDHDRYYGPFTYAHEPRYRKFSVMLGSGDDDDYPGCRLRLSAGSHTLILALPPVIKPWKRWREITTEPSRSQMVSQGRKPGYWDRHEREYGFSTFEGSLHIHFGEQTHEWPGAKSKVFFYPWRAHRSIRHSIYDTEGRHFADLPDWNLKSPNGWAAKSALEAACPVSRFEFADFDGEKIVATCRIEEREWRRGSGLFRLLYLGRNKIARSLDLAFSSEVGKRKGSWKGGTVGHSCEIASGEPPENAFRRYCEKQGLTFLSRVADSASGSHGGDEGEAGVNQKSSSPSMKEGTQP